MLIKISAWVNKKGEMVQENVSNYLEIFEREPRSLPLDNDDYNVIDPAIDDKDDEDYSPALEALKENLYIRYIKEMSSSQRANHRLLLNWLSLGIWSGEKQRRNKSQLSS